MLIPGLGLPCSQGFRRAPPPSSKLVAPTLGWVQPRPSLALPPVCVPASSRPASPLPAARPPLALACSRGDRHLKKKQRRQEAHRLRPVHHIVYVERDPFAHMQAIHLPGTSHTIAICFLYKWSYIAQIRCNPSISHTLTRYSPYIGHGKMYALAGCPAKLRLAGAPPTAHPPVAGRAPPRLPSTASASHPPTARPGPDAPPRALGLLRLAPARPWLFHSFASV